MADVSIVRCATYESPGIDAAVKQAVDYLGGIARFVAPGQKVLLKPNLLKGAAPEQAVTTHPALIRAVIRLVKERTDAIVIGDSPGIPSHFLKAELVYEQCGITALAREENVRVASFDAVTTIDGIPFAKIKDTVDVIISLPKLKTHNLTMLTAGVKNMYGMVSGLHKVHIHKQAPNFRVFAKKLVSIFAQTRPALTILDAVVAMQGDGPAGGDPYALGMVLAAGDAVALDAVAADIIGYAPHEVLSTQEAMRAGLGEGDLSRITLHGETLAAARVRDFAHPKIGPLYRLPNAVTQALFRLIPLMMRVDSQRCTRCGVCRNVCPQGAISEHRGRLRIDSRRCILCMCCSEMCPHNAVGMRFFGRRKEHAKCNSHH